MTNVNNKCKVTQTVQSNYQDLLKTLAIITMIVDHFGLYFFPEYSMMRVIGRMAMPLFCFFAGYNFNNYPKIRILFFGIIILVMSMISMRQFFSANILISIFLGQCYIYLFQKQLITFNKAYLHVIFTGILFSLDVTNAFMDYGMLVISIMILGYMAKHNLSSLRLNALISIIIAMMHSIAFFFTFFSSLDILLLMIFYLIEYLLMIIYKFDKPVHCRISIISRNVLYIYLIHLIFIELIFGYLNIW